MVGSGPFQLTEWNKGEDWTMTANPNYWGGAPQIQPVQGGPVRQLRGDGQRAEERRDRLHEPRIGRPVQPVASRGRRESGITTHVGPAVSFGQMSFNMCDPTSPTPRRTARAEPGSGNPALRDPAVRTAISWAIDRQTIVDKVLAGYGAPGTTIVPPFASFYHYEPTRR